MPTACRASQTETALAAAVSSNSTHDGVQPLHAPRANSHAHTKIMLKLKVTTCARGWCSPIGVRDVCTSDARLEVPAPNCCKQQLLYLPTNETLTSCLNVRPQCCKLLNLCKADAVHAATYQTARCLLHTAVAMAIRTNSNLTLSKTPLRRGLLLFVLGVLKGQVGLIAAAPSLRTNVASLVCWPGSFTTECCSRARVGGLLDLCDHHTRLTRSYSLQQCAPRVPQPWLTCICTLQG